MGSHASGVVVGAELCLKNGLMIDDGVLPESAEDLMLLPCPRLAFVDEPLTSPVEVVYAIPGALAPKDFLRR